MYIDRGRVYSFSSKHYINFLYLIIQSIPNIPDGYALYTSHSGGSQTSHGTTNFGKYLNFSADSVMYNEVTRKIQYRNIISIT